MSTPLTLRTDRGNDGTLVLIAVGEIDLSNIDMFARALNKAASQAPMVTVDLGGVDYLYSGAINALYTHADHIHLIVNRFLLPVLTVSGLTELATVQLIPPVAES
jgi:anti-anti-sigma regulatory factor